jgi:hypothetical protein
MTDELARRSVAAAFLADVAGASPPALLAQGAEAGVFVRDSVGSPMASGFGCRFRRSSCGRGPIFNTCTAGDVVDLLSFRRIP